MTRRIVPALVLLLALGALSLATAIGASPAEAGKKRAKKAACAPSPATLYPTKARSTADRFTMILRVNKLSDVDEFASSVEAAGGLRPRIRDRDIFLINTRFEPSDQATEQGIAAKLRQQFPCNRIFALNGESFDPNSPQGYIFSLIDAPEVSAILMDWEQMDWPGPGPWVKAFKPNLKRLTARLMRLGRQIKSVPGRTSKSFGVVPFFHKNWDHGTIARTVQQQNSLLARGRQGFQSIQTQGYCQTQNGGPGAIRPKIKTLFRQYKRSSFDKARHKGIKPKLNSGNLGVQVSFTATPDASSPLPVKSVSASEAAACTAVALSANAGAILYWARPSDIDAMLADPGVCALRPSPSGVC